MENKFSSEDYWRTIIHYGVNVATYKIALAKCLYNFSKTGITQVSMRELAKEFFHQYRDRLQNEMLQLDNPARLTKMEHIANLYNIEKVSEDKAIGLVEREAFSDVVPRFHTVNTEKIPVSFYEYNKKGLILTDNVFRIFEGKQEKSLISEVDSRWGLLEAAFQLKKGDAKLINDIRLIYLANGYKRTAITGTIPVLNGYQNGV